MKIYYQYVFVLQLTLYMRTETMCVNIFSLYYSLLSFMVN